MYQYRVAVIDDKESTRQQVADELRALLHVDVETAADAPAALELLNNEFFDLVLLDLQLDESSDTLDGKEIYEYIARHRTATKVVMMTNFATTDAVVELLYDLFRPGKDFDPTAVFAGLVDKGDVEPRKVAKEYVEKHLTPWVNSLIEIPEVASERILADIDSARMIPGWYFPGSVARSAKVHEIDHVVSTLLGQSTSAESPLRSRRVEFAEEGDTALRPPVYMARIASSVGPPMSWVLLKIGNVTDIEREAQRYEHFARFDIGPDHRVELLSTAYGNCVGAISYGIAAAQPSEMKTLRDWMDADPEMAVSVIHRVFAREAKHWYYHEDKAIASLAWFNSRYSASRFAQRASSFRDELSHVSSIDAREPQGASIHPMDDGIHFGNEEGIIALPSKDDQGLVDIELPTCVVHGTLISANVLTIVDRNERIQPGEASPPMAVKLIDFRQTEIGPRCLDFALMSMDLRLPASYPATDPVSIARYVTAERQLANRCWTGDADSLLKECLDDAAWVESEPWERMAALLVANLRQNFSEVTREEFAVTCCLVALGESLAPRFADQDSYLAARLRTSVWLDPEIRYLREEGIRVGR